MKKLIFILLLLPCLAEAQSNFVSPVNKIAIRYNRLCYWNGSSFVPLADSSASGITTNIYTADGTLSGNRTVTSNNNAFIIYGTGTGAQFSMQSRSIGTDTLAQVGVVNDGASMFASRISNSIRSEVNAYTDSIRLVPYNGDLRITKLNAQNNTDDSMLVFNRLLHKVGYRAIPSGGGGGITALTGDVTASGSGSVAATLATVNSNVGSFGSSTSIPSLTVNGKGLVTAVSTNAVVAPAGTLSGATLASGVTVSSLTSFGNNPTIVKPSVNNITGNYTTTATAAGTTTLTNASTYLQYFTGSTTQTCVLPDATTLIAGQAFEIHNNSSGVVTVNANGGGLVQTMAASTIAIITVTNIGSSAGTYEVSYSLVPLTTGVSGILPAANGGTGVANSNTLTLAGGNNITLTTSGTTSVTLPQNGTLSAVAGVETLTNKTVSLTAGTTGAAPLGFAAGTNLTTPVAGKVEYDGGNFYTTPEATAGRGVTPSFQTFRLTSNGSTISTIANFFGSTSNPTLVSGGEYIIEIDLYYTNTTAGTVTWTFTNSAAPTSQNIHARFSPVAGIVAPAGSAAATYLEGDVQGDATAAKALTTSGTLTDATTQWAHFSIHLYNSTGTSLKIQATKLVGGTITPLKGSYWTCTKVPAANVGIFVN